MLSTFFSVWLLRFVQCIGLLASSSCWTELIAQEAIDRDRPHPWLVDAPPAFSRLVDVGSVKIAVDQPAVDAAGRTALTVFSFSFAHRMRYRFHEMDDDSDGKPRVRITASFHDVAVSASHRILLSSSFRPAKPWESALLLHEFDHVAISTDPRLFEMLRSLEGKRVSLIVLKPESIELSDAWAKEEIEKSSKKFQQAVEKLVQSYYVRLDDVSSNGLKDVADRSRFFTELFSLEGLKKGRFAYLEDVQDYITHVAPEQIKQHYRLP